MKIFCWLDLVSRLEGQRLPNGSMESVGKVLVDWVRIVY